MRAPRFKLILCGMLLFFISCTYSSTELIAKETSRFVMFEGRAYGISEGIVLSQEEGENWSWSDPLYYKDTKGKKIINRGFKSASLFHEGLAFVTENTVDAYDYSNIKGGYIDYKGEYILPPIYTTGGRFRNGFAIVELHPGYQIIDTKGNFILNKFYDDIIFHDNMYFCESNDKTEVLNAKFNLIRTLNITKITKFIEDDGVKFIVHDGYELNMVLKIVNFNTGATVFEKVYDDDIHGSVISINKGVIHVIISSERIRYTDKHYDLEGNELQGYIVPMTHNKYFLRNDENQCFIVENDVSKKVDYIMERNTTEEVFAAGVSVDNNKKNEDIIYTPMIRGVVDIDGNIIVPFKYESIYLPKDETSTIYAYSKDGVVDIFDKTGKLKKQLKNIQRERMVGSYLSCEDKDRAAYLVDNQGDYYMNIEGVRYISEPEIGNSEEGIFTVEKGKISYVALDNAVINKDIPEYSYEKVYYNGDTFDNPTTLYVMVGKNTKCVNGEYSYSSGVPYIKNGKCFVPLHLIDDSFADITIGGRDMVSEGFYYPCNEI